MKFPNIQDLKGYKDLLTANGCQVQVAEDTGRFAACVDLYLDMLNKQLTYDALRIIVFNMKLTVPDLGWAEESWLTPRRRDGGRATGLY